MISIKDWLPKENEKTKCRVNFWRYGQYDTEIIEARYIGMNNIIGKPRWDIKTHDMSYAEVTHWESID